MKTIIHLKPVTDSAKHLDSWLGLQCNHIVRRENDWQFDFGMRQGVTADCPWRIIDSGRIAHADEDDGQRFGLPEPIIGAKRAHGLLAGKKIISAEILPITGDLKIHFETGTSLEFFNNSSGYESWQAAALKDKGLVNLVAQGGGQISMWEDEA